MEPKFLEIKRPVEVETKSKRKYTKKVPKNDNESLLRRLGSVLEPSKKKLKLELMHDSNNDSNKVEKKLEAIQKLDEKAAERKLSKIETEQLQKLSSTVAKGFCNALGQLFDTILKGNGHIKKEFNNDKALEFALAKEVSVLTALLSNRAKIIVCGGNNIGTGFMNARLKAPLIEQISETNENALEENGPKAETKKSESKGPSDSWATG